MLKAGASGYLLKDCALEELVNTIRTVTEARKTYLSPGPVHLRHFGLGIGEITGGAPTYPIIIVAKEASANRSEREGLIKQFANGG